MENISRRSFIGAMGALAGTGIAPVVAFAGEESETAQIVDGAADEWFGYDPQALADRGGTTLSVEELNRIRHERVDGLGDLECEDGSVIPAVWHKLAVLTDCYGFGSSFIVKVPIEQTARYIMDLYDNDEDGAAHYLEMPWGKVFSAYEYAQASGLGIDEATAICDDLAVRGLLYRSYMSGGARYHHMPIAHGLAEYSVERLRDPERTASLYANLMNGSFDEPNYSNLVTAATPMYYSIPCDKSIVSDERVLPLNDVEVLLDRHDKFCLLPCFCSTHENVVAGIEVPPKDSDEYHEFRNGFEEGEGHHLERCFAFGEQAEYYLSIGAGREVTRDEARAVIERNVDEGLVLQMGYTNDSDILCSCHSDCCGILATYVALGPDAFAGSPIQKNCSNYLLEYDRDACIQCGACIARCPMGAISMDDTDHPEVNAVCVRCGQCGLVCPAHARTLTARPAADRLPVPDDHMDDHNRKFGYRIEHDLH